MVLIPEFYEIVWVKPKVNPFTTEFIIFPYELKSIWLKQGLRMQFKDQYYKNTKFMKIF